MYGALEIYTSLHGWKLKPIKGKLELSNFCHCIQARSHNETNEAVASPKISKKNLPQMKNS